MRTLLLSIFLAGLFAFIRAPAVIAKEPERTLLSADSAEIIAFVNRFSGIEFLFVFDNDPEKMAANLRTLLEFKQDGIPSFLENYRIEYRITGLRLEERIMTSECTTCESSQVMSYWDTEDGGALMAVVTKGCGPMCSYETRFYKYKDGKKERIDRELILPSVILADFLKDPMDADAVQSGTAYEMPVWLRQSGYDISIGLWLEDASYNDKLKGDLIPFMWNGLNFFQGELTNSK